MIKISIDSEDSVFVDQTSISAMYYDRLSEQTVLLLSGGHTIEVKEKIEDIFKKINNPSP